MGAQESLDLDVVFLGPHGHEELDAVAANQEKSEEEDSHYERRTPIAILASRASLVR